MDNFTFDRRTRSEKKGSECLNTYPLCRSGITFVATLVVALALAATQAGDRTLEIPIPEEVEKGLESVGIEIETKPSWVNDPAVWIAGGIVIAGLVIAYAIRSRKS